MLGQGDLEKLTIVFSAACGQRLVEAWHTVFEEAGIVSLCHAVGLADDGPRRRITAATREQQRVETHVTRCSDAPIGCRRRLDGVNGMRLTNRMGSGVGGCPPPRRHGIGTCIGEPRAVAELEVSNRNTGRRATPIISDEIGGRDTRVFHAVRVRPGYSFFRPGEPIALTPLPEIRTGGLIVHRAQHTVRPSTPRSWVSDGPHSSYCVLAIFTGENRCSTKN